MEKYDPHKTRNVAHHQTTTISYHMTIPAQKSNGLCLVFTGMTLYAGAINLNIFRE